MMYIKEHQQSIVYKFSDKKTELEVSVNKQLAEELHKTVIKKLKRIEVYTRFKYNIWVADLAEMESLSSKNKNTNYLWCATDVFTKYAWVKTLKDYWILNEPNRKPNKLLVDQGRKFYSKPMQERFENNDILMYSTQNEGKSVIAERFTKTLKAKIYKKWQLMIANLVSLIWINQ